MTHEMVRNDDLSPGSLVISDSDSLGFSVAKALAGDKLPTRLENGLRSCVLFVISDKDDCFVLLEPEAYARLRGANTETFAKCLKNDNKRWKISIQETDYTYKGYVFTTSALINNLQRTCGGGDRDSIESRSSNSEMQRECDEIFKAGIESQASDIHFVRRGEKEDSTIWMRRKGILSKYKRIDRDYLLDLIRAAYNTMTTGTGGSTTFNARTHQEGYLIREIDKKSYSLRYIHSPISPESEDSIHAVVRIASNEVNEKSESLVDMGYLPGQARLLNFLFKQPSGMILFAGKVNSGKSTTMRKMMQDLIVDSDYRKVVVTIEDPVEGRIHGALQSPVVPVQEGDAFQAAVKTTSRRDLDALMLGEIRDGESLKSSIKLANSGLLVVGSIHANSALGAIPRLEDLGRDLSGAIIDRRTICNPDVIVGLVYQKLVPLICPDCSLSLDQAKKQERIDKALVDRIQRVTESDTEISNIKVRGIGCESCNHDSVIGRTPCAEVMPIDAKLRKFLRDGQDDEAKTYIREQKQGNIGNNPIGVNALDVGIYKMSQGLICPTDVESELGTLTHDLVTQDGAISNQELASLFGEEI